MRSLSMLSNFAVHRALQGLSRHHSYSSCCPVTERRLRRARACAPQPVSA